MTDILVHDIGTIVLFRPVSAAGRAWMQWHISSDAAHLGDNTVVEHRRAGTGGSMTMQTVTGADLKVGDLVDTGWYGTHIITAITPHPRWSEMFPGSSARLLEFDGGKVGGMTADGDGRFEVFR